MRVVHVVCTDAFAGVEQHVARLAAGQVLAGHAVIVIGGDVSSVARSAPGVRVLPSQGLIHDAHTIRSLAPGADIVHAHMTAAEVAAALGLVGFTDTAARVRVVSTRHFARSRGSGALGRVKAAIAASRVDAQIAISRFVADHIEGTSTVVLPGVGMPEAARSTDERDNVVLVAQRLETEKETYVAIEAFARSTLPRLGWRLVIAGDGGCRSELEHLVGERGLHESVSFLGRRDDVPELMSDSALLVAPCSVEGLGLTVVEAMAHGLPVVAARAGGHLETAGRVEGAPLFQPHDVDAASSLLDDLAGDRDRRSQLAIEGRAVVATMTLDSQVVATDAVYRSVLTGLT